VKLYPAVAALAAGLVLAEAGHHAAAHLAGTWPPRRGDFEAYYWAGRRVDSGNLAELYSSFARDPGSDRRIKDFKNVPLVAAAFVPLSRLEYDTAWKAWWAFSLACCVGIVALAALWLRRWCGHWLLAAAVAASAGLHYFPLLDAFELGQTTQAVAFVLLVAYLALARGRAVLAGALLAVAALVKVPVFVMGGFLLLTRRWRAAAAFGATVAALFGLSVVLFGAGVHRAWLGDAIGPHAGTALTALNNQSLAAQLARLWGDEQVHSYRPSPLPAPLSAARWAMAAAVVLGWLAVRRRLSDRAVLDRGVLDLDFVMALSVMPLVSPIFWIHYFLLSLPALLVLSRHAAAPGAWPLRATLVASYLLAAWYPPADLTWYGRAPGFWGEVGNGRFLYSSFLLAACCVMAATAVPRRATSDS
jgi:hypothetical protein